ncbi:MAG: DUF72 domain-containing protein [Candidatus Helarchaeota archaeon]
MFVGCGGWHYFNVPGDKLEQYSRIFNFVEVNTTFYHLPQLKTVRKWRKKVPPEFEFAVKVNKSITHDSPLVLSEKNLKILNHLIKTCKYLNSSYLIFQMPKKYHPTRKNLELASLFFEQVQRKDLELFMELRGPFSSSSEKNYFKLFCKKNKITHVTDIFKELPLHFEKTFYTRIFGRGNGNKWQFSSQEIKDARDFLKPFEPERKVVVSFHTMRMENDAARFGHYDKTGSILPISDEKGIKAALFAIQQFIHFPLNKKKLLAEHGWKLIPLENESEMRLSTLLNFLEEKPISSYQELKSGINKAFLRFNLKN